MIKMRRQLLGLGFMAASSLMAMNAAHAMNGPTAIKIDGGPLGTLELSGGMDGYGSYTSGLAGHQPDTGMNVGSALINLEKTSGVLQYTIEVGSNGGAIPVGTLFSRPGQTSISKFKTGPLYAGYITVAPTDSPVTFSAGMIGSVEGYESGIDWNNATQMVTDIWYVENSQSKGVSATYSQGPLTATVEFGDGWDTNVFNFLQASVDYSFDDNNSLYVYYGGNLGRTTGPNVTSYGSQVGSITNLINSQMFGAFYSWTHGNLNLVPEVQYVYAKPDAKANISKYTSNFGAAVFADYSFANTPYSIGGWVQYEKSIGSQYAWFVTPNDQAVGLAVSPTWQYKDVFARVNAGANYLLTKTSGGGYGNSGNGNFQFVGTLEAGLLF
ncbi:porin family protein [Acidocella aminolytica]|jgi:hypothetical protein|uniref:Porin n=1 Tax=Acidocella aminolytica 101 = DSM 11237 TaxID=1120923 RepID=A0A0D6PHQ3_9PROT|nr:hypothetical protein [Acidocella aminolytica]GAN81300.1 hypothetical protein Aam_089_093 [Acidocella aminolytica 101 = DSM 11237]GBQ34222.1 hypothetical protein AA11237_0690 [Acidocella aminolytica 101 = DSM 11237]SHE83208.1 hypothetical protein SAMN02746095_01319 [Acidocella aminolytica 101 = DSM 11237]